MSNPRFTPTKEQRMMVEVLAACGTPQEEIRRVITHPNGKAIRLHTLHREFRHELDTAMTRANAKVGAALFNAAVKGDTASMIFWAKTRMGFREVNRTEWTGKNGGPVQVQPLQAPAMDMSRLSDAELEQLETLMMKAQVAAASAPAEAMPPPLPAP